MNDVLLCCCDMKQRHMSPVKYTPAKSQTPERNVDDEDKEDDDTKQNDAEDGGDDDMWKLWNKTYDSKHNVAVKNPSQEIKPAAKPAYQVWIPFCTFCACCIYLIVYFMSTFVLTS